MTVLSEEQISTMTQVMDEILKNHNTSVIDIKTKYGLTDDEYNMIFNLCMPNVRSNTWEAFWKQTYGSLRKEIRKVIRTKELSDAKKLSIIREMCDYSYQPKKLTDNEEDTEEEGAN